MLAYVLQVKVEMELEIQQCEKTKAVREEQLERLTQICQEQAVSTWWNKKKKKLHWLKWMYLYDKDPRHLLSYLSLHQSFTNNCNEHKVGYLFLNNKFQ